MCNECLVTPVTTQNHKNQLFFVLVCFLAYMSGLDVIGRRNQLCETLNLPNVLICVVNEYMGIELVPTHRIPCKAALYDIGEVHGKDLYWFCEDRGWMCNNKRFVSTTNPSKIYQVNTSFLVVVGPRHFQIRDLKTKTIYFKRFETNVVVCDEIVYFTSAHNIWSYEVSSHKEQQITYTNDAKSVHTLYKTVWYTTYAGKCRVLYEEEYLPNVEHIMDYNGIRYLIHSNSIRAKGLESICMSEIFRVFATDGFLYLITKWGHYVIDLIRWQFTWIREHTCYVVNSRLVRKKNNMLEVF